VSIQEVSLNNKNTSNLQFENTFENKFYLCLRKVHFPRIILPSAITFILIRVLRYLFRYYNYYFYIDRSG